MNYRKLGKSELYISEIGFGCMSLDDDQAANSKIIHGALDGGINFFDTADLYQKGYNESMVGKALKEKRKNIILATKVGNRWREDGSGWDWCANKKYIQEAIEKSLTRLQTDYIDLYQLHGGTIEDPIEEVTEAFENLQQQGKIRYYGISSIRPNVIREYVSRSNIVSVLMQYSLLDRRPEETCLGLLLQSNIGVLARGVLAKGLLIDKPAERYMEFNVEVVKEILLNIQSIIGDTISKTGIALQYVLKHPAITSAVAGIRTTEHLTGILSASKEILNDRQRKFLEQLPSHKYLEHR